MTKLWVPESMTIQTDCSLCLQCPSQVYPLKRFSVMMWAVYQERVFCLVSQQEVVSAGEESLVREPRLAEVVQC